MKIKIARVVTLPFTLISLRELFNAMIKDSNFEITIISNSDGYLKVLKDEYPQINFKTIKIERKLSPFRDLSILILLIQYFNKEKFDIVHSHTPKAGLLVAIAGFISRRRVRIHTFTGQVWVDYKGLKRLFYVRIDRLIAKLNTICFADSHGQKNYLIENGVGNSDIIRVLGKGSFAGIDLEKFDLKKLERQALELRENLYPSFNGKIILYLGRINNDKGVRELLSAYENLSLKFNVTLLIVGPMEYLDNEVQEKLIEMKKRNKVILIDFVTNPEVYIALCDVYCLPSYREGCPTTVIEASALRKPVVASNIYGIRDVVLEGITGELCTVRSEKSLEQSLEKIILNETRAIEMGKKGRQFVEENFSSKTLALEMLDTYKSLVKNLLAPSKI